MALPTVGGGYQIGDGNVNEIFMGEMADPQTATATATSDGSEKFSVISSPTCRFGGERSERF